MERSASRRTSPRDQPLLTGLDLKAEILREDPALGQAAGDEPEAGLAGAREHGAKLVVLTETPDGTDALSDLVAEQPPHENVLALVTGREHDQIGVHPRSNVARDVGPLEKARRLEGGRLKRLERREARFDEKLELVMGVKILPILIIFTVP